MSEEEQKIARISSLLNSAIKYNNSKDYKVALSMLEKCNPKPSFQQILEAQAKENKRLEHQKKQELVDFQTKEKKDS
jgi:hypothetical protein